MSPHGRLPSQGNTLASSRLRMVSRWLETHVCDDLACHSRAMASKSPALDCAAFSARRAWDGSMPAASWRRAESRFSRAAFSGTSG